MTCPEPALRGYVYQRDTSMRILGQPKTTRPDWNRKISHRYPLTSCVEPSPTSYNGLFISTSPKSSTNAVTGETSWEGCGQSPLVCPRIVPSQCWYTFNDFDKGVYHQKCDFKFVSDEKYLAHLIKVHGKRPTTLEGWLAQGGTTPRRWPEKGLKRVRDDPQRLRQVLKRQIRQTAASEKECSRPSWRNST